jgi:DNA-binding IclR family transcriptional regulator
MFLHNALISLHMVKYMAEISIRVLAKAMAILRHVANAAPRPVLPGEVASACDLNAATAVRLMRDLLAAGLLRQGSRRQGYMLGPLAYKLGQACAWEQGLARAAGPVVDGCARAFPCAALLAIRAGESRYVLNDCNATGNPVCDARGVCHRDLYGTATGRVLLAHAPPDEAARVTAVCGMPRPESWPEATGRKGLSKALAAIRSDGVAFKDDGTHQAAAAPVFCAGRFVAAFGVVVARASSAGVVRGRLCMAARDGAAAVTRALDSVTAAG